jgi:hypothetical protein
MTVDRLVEDKSELFLQPIRVRFLVCIVPFEVASYYFVQVVREWKAGGQDVGIDSLGKVSV